MVNRGDVDKCWVPPPIKKREKAIGRSGTGMQGRNSLAGLWRSGSRGAYDTGEKQHGRDQVAEGKATSMWPRG